jgi:hypothetical protein
MVTNHSTRRATRKQIWNDTRISGGHRDFAVLLLGADDEAKVVIQVEVVVAGLTWLEPQLVSISNHYYVRSSVTRMW